MSQPTERMIKTNGISLNVAEHGEGPLVPLLRDIQMLPGCGHWTQQERPTEVNAALIEFLRSLPS